MAAPSHPSAGEMEVLNKSFNRMDLVDIKEYFGGTEKGEGMNNMMLPLEPLFRLCLKYYKENIGKASSVSYQDKTRLLALQKQVVSGPYKPDGANEPGFLDVVGNDRKVAWQALGDMSKEDAQKEFIKLLHKCSPSLKPYVIAFKVQQDEEERKKKQAEEEKRKKAEQEEAEKMAAAAQRQSEAQKLQEQQVRQALNQQTEAQFRAYAQTQFPGDNVQQEALIKQLQEQHFQQYVRQVYEQQMRAQQQLQQQQQAAYSQATAASSLTQNISQLPSSSQENPVLPGNTKVNPQELLQGATSVKPDLSQPTHNEQINGHDTTDHTDSIVIQEASMWTQKDIVAFKNAIKKESKAENHSDCIIKVGSGETVTIRVPTHENGNCLFWEFATDYYDLAFGVYFEWTTSTDDNVQVHISDSSDEEEEEPSAEGEKSDPERGSQASKVQGPPIDEIIPIYRRDCHEEVYCGSHVYPGRGVYLLKFDNSYSLWRGKTLYYRVYYSR